MPSIQRTRSQNDVNKINANDRKANPKIQRSKSLPLANIRNSIDAKLRALGDLEKQSAEIKKQIQLLLKQAKPINDADCGGKVCPLPPKNSDPKNNEPVNNNVKPPKGVTPPKTPPKVGVGGAHAAGGNIPLPASKVTEVHHDNFDDMVKVSAAEVPVLVKVGATWCGPCKQIQPYVEKVAQKYGDRLRVAFFDVDKTNGEKIAGRFGENYKQLVPDQRFLGKLRVDGFPSFYMLYQGKIKPVSMQDIERQNLNKFLPEAVRPVDIAPKQEIGHGDIDRRGIDHRGIDRRGIDRIDIDPRESDQKLALDELAPRNLTEEAKKGLLNPAWGREAELRQLVQILCQTGKSSPMLLGEPGVGKTSLVEGLAYKISKGDVPDVLKDTVVRVLNLEALAGGDGAKYRGGLEEKIKDLLDELKEANYNKDNPSQPHKKVLLFVDEIHKLAANSKQYAGLDQSIKEGLEKGYFVLIGATTSVEYNKYFANDLALKQRFLTINVNEPNREAAIAMVLSQAQKLKNEKGVNILYDAVVAAVDLSKQYLDGANPRAAIDVLRQAVADVWTKKNSEKSLEAETIEGKIQRTDLQITFLKEEILAIPDSDKLQQQIDALQKEKENFQNDLAEINQRYADEKQYVVQIEQLLTEIKKASTEAEKEGLSEEEKAKLKQQVDELRGKYMAQKGELTLLQQRKPLLPLVVGSLEVVNAVSAKANIPSGQLLGDETEQLDKLSEKLKEQVIGQDNAIDGLADQLLMHRLKLVNENKPVVAMLAGPSGTGKTRTAEVLADALNTKLLQLNMASFHNGASINQLIGSPAGYIGHGNATIFDQVRRNPNLVIVLDEFNQAHEEVQKFFFNIFDKGEMYDAQNQKVDFRNAVILLTSNVGTNIIRNSPNNLPYAELQNKVREELKDGLGGDDQYAGAPLVARISTVLPYYPISGVLGEDVIKELIEKELNSVKGRYQKSLSHVSIEFDESILSHLVAQVAQDKSGEGVRGITGMINSNVTNGITKTLKDEGYLRTKEPVAVVCAWKNNRLEVQVKLLAETEE